MVWILLEWSTRVLRVVTYVYTCMLASWAGVIASARPGVGFCSFMDALARSSTGKH
jgi:hypothetical protein